MTERSEKILREGAEKMGILLTDEQVRRFSVLTGLLLEWNERMNLTAVREEEDVVRKHYLDSLSLAGFCGLEGKGDFIDVGCGAGFPGLPIRILFPGINATFLDATGKKLEFIRAALDTLSINGGRCLHMRAEEAGKAINERERYDAAAARAVAELRVLAEYCLPLVKIGGVFYAMKGPDAEAEAADAKNALAQLGGEVEAVKKFTVPDSDLSRTVFVIRKVRRTPEKYPRPNARIAKTPL